MSRCLCVRRGGPGDGSTAAGGPGKSFSVGVSQPAPLPDLSLSPGTRRGRRRPPRRRSKARCGQPGDAQSSARLPMTAAGGGLPCPALPPSLRRAPRAALQNKAEKDPGSVTSLKHVSWACKHNNVSYSTGGTGKAAELRPRSRLCPGSTRAPRRHVGGRGEGRAVPASHGSPSRVTAPNPLGAQRPRHPCARHNHQPAGPGDPARASPLWATTPQLQAHNGSVQPRPRATTQTDRQRVTDANRASISHSTCRLLPAHEPNPCHGYNHSPGALLQARTAMSPSRGDQLPTQRKPRWPRRWNMLGHGEPATLR